MKVDIGTVNPHDKNIVQLTSVTDTREWWCAKGNGTWYLNLAIAGYASEMWGFVSSYVISGHITQVFVPLNFEYPVLRRSASPTNSDRWNWITDDIAKTYPLRSPTLTADRLPNSYPYGSQMYLARPQLSGFPCSGILMSLKFSGQIKQILLKDNSTDMYVRYANASSNTWSAWRQITTAAV